MLVIDENISEIEVWRLREWGVAVRQIGPDVAKLGLGDDNILPLLHKIKRPTFFTRDRDFWKPALRHMGYCLVFLDIPEHEGEVATAARRFLGQADFDTFAKRMGTVVRLHADGIHYWQIGRQLLQRVCLGGNLTLRGWSGICLWFELSPELVCPWDSLALVRAGFHAT